MKKNIQRLSVFFVLILFSFTTVWALTTDNEPITIKILGVNDFHGQISTGRKLNNRPVGGAAVLASYLKQGKSEVADNTIVAFSGDLVGASPPASGLLNHEPSILFFNTLGNSHCSTLNRMEAKCNLVATVGNHEFDRGQQTLFDLIYGTKKPPFDNWIPLPVYPGASFPFISANIINKKTGENIFPPYVIKNMNGVKIGFIGAILKDAPSVILPKQIENLEFLDEAIAINHYIPEVKAKGAEVIVVLIHQGGVQTPYEDATRENEKAVGPITSIIDQLDNNVEVVMAAHVHQFINAYIPNKNGKKILVTEANCYSASFAEVTLSLDKQNHHVLNKSAKIINTYADQVPGTTLDAKATTIVKFAENKIQPIINISIGTLTNDLHKKGNANGESDLGNLLADAYKNILQADFGITNPGAIRADLFAGTVTWGNAYSVQPFANVVGILKLTGQDIYELFEQQWTDGKNSILQISGLNYIYDANKPVGHRIVAIYKNKELLQLDKTYTVATNEFLAGGGDGFTVMQRGTFIPTEDVDLDIFIKHIKSLPQPFSAVIEGRITRI